MSKQEFTGTDQFAVAICCHDDFYYLEATIRCYSPIPVTVFVSTKAWNSSTGDWEECVAVAKRAGAEVVLGAWDNEENHRRAALAEMKRRGIRWLFVVDGDELMERKLINNLQKLALTGLYDHFRVRMYTYWRSPHYRIFPPENIAPVVLIDAQKCEHIHCREYSFTSSITLGFEHGALHHLSWAGDDRRIRRKCETSSHRADFRQDYYEEIYCGWDADHTLRNLHPCDPPCYGYAERIPVPDILKDVPDERPLLTEPPLPENWGTISLVISLFGGEVDIFNCLKSVEACGIVNWAHGEMVNLVGKGIKPKIRYMSHPPVKPGRPDLLYEVIVVDDCSPDKAVEVAAQFPFVKLIRHETNQGFAGTNNTGINAATGDYVYLLNSDALITRSSVIELGKTVMSSGTIGAAGPMSNRVGYQQLFAETMSDLANLDLFSTDFAHREVDDFDNSMLVGFALMVPRRIFTELGLLDTAFGRGYFEDTDLAHRIQRARYRTVICPRSFVWHEGSKSMVRTGEHSSVAMARNGAYFRNKHRLDLESGFAAWLAGDRPGPILFDESKRPEKLIEEMKRLAKKHQVSVTLIGRDEERCVGEALDSLLGIFPQIVFVDTGSVDRTVEIAKSKGCEVYETTWKDSFAIGRNFSLKHAKGKWCFWIDCDDVVPFQTLWTLLTAIDQAPPHITGFVIPVQFVEAIPGMGTRVDHIKVFRNDPRLFWEGRIHEQILGSIRAIGGEVVRLNCHVLHQNYDSTPDGQRKKRLRDRKLLKLDLVERPGHLFVLFNLGMTAFFSGHYRVAIGWLRRSLRGSETLEESHVRKAYALYSEALHQLGRLGDAITVAETGLAAAGEDPELRYNLGRYLAEAGDLEGAKANYEAINPDITGFFSSIDVGILTFKRFLNLGAVCFGLRMEGVAKDYLREAVRSNPLHPACAEALFEAGMKTGDINCARQAAEVMAAAQGHTERWAMAMASIYELAGVPVDDNLAGLTNLLPLAIGPRLVLAKRLIGTGRIPVALHFLRQAESLGSPDAAHMIGEILARGGALEEAQVHLGIALQLAPHSEISRNLSDAIELAREDMKPLPAFTGGLGQAVLVGPHVGRLGPASIDHSVVVVTFNSQAFIRECAERVLRDLGPSDELIVVDNASTDGTIAILNALAAGDSRVRLLPQSENLRYAKACNVGLLASRGTKLTALNPDAFVGDGCFAGLASGLAENVAAVGPSSDNITGDQFVGHYVHGSALSEKLFEIMATEQAGVVKPTRLLMGVCLMMRRDLLDKHGLLREETVLGADDLEFSWRMRMLAYELRVVPGIFVRHIGQASFSTLPSLEVRRLVRQSDRALVMLFQAYYGAGNIPSSMELFGCDIFAEALARPMPSQ